MTPTPIPPAIVIRDHRGFTIKGAQVTYATPEIRAEIEGHLKEYGTMELPAKYTYEIKPSSFHGQVAKVVYREGPTGEAMQPTQGRQPVCWNCGRKVEWLPNGVTPYQCDCGAVDPVRPVLPATAADGEIAEQMHTEIMNATAGMFEESVPYAEARDKAAAACAAIASRAVAAATAATTAKDAEIAELEAEVALLHQKINDIIEQHNRDTAGGW